MELAIAYGAVAAWSSFADCLLPDDLSVVAIKSKQ